MLVARAFVRMRELAAVHADLTKRLSELEQKTEGLALTHDTFSRNTALSSGSLLRQSTISWRRPTRPSSSSTQFGTPEPLGRTMPT